MINLMRGTSLAFNISDGSKTEQEVEDYAKRTNKRRPEGVVKWVNETSI